MIATMMLAAIQAATPVPPVALPSAKGERTIVREVIVDRPADGSASSERVIRVTVDESKAIRVVPCGDKGDMCAVDDPHAKDEVKTRSGQERREIRVVRGAGPADGASVKSFSCAKGAKVESETLDKDGNKNRIMICAMGDSNVSKAQQLRDAAKRIEADTNLSPETRTRLAVAINEAIAKLPVNE
ncbi:hypothetical protein V6R86_06015 [Sphingomonas kaistensis]|uniref:Uncharacterized protein n=1 Tax=Sphingomonas kaistensis TaxID=298708 RepID=A0ABZ2G336_9SPHN